MARGSTLRATLAFVESVAGPDAVAHALAGLRARDRARVQAVGATHVFPAALWQRLSAATDTAIGAAVPDRPERAGAHAIESYGVQPYGGILRDASPLLFVTQSVSLFRHYYHRGDMKLVEQDAVAERGGRVVLRSVGFDSGDAIVCRRQTGEGGAGARSRRRGAAAPAPRALHARGGRLLRVGARLALGGAGRSLPPTATARRRGRVARSGCGT